MKDLKYIGIVGLLCLFFYPAFTQINESYEQFHPANNKKMRSGMDLSPNGKLLALAGMQGAPLLIYDWKNDKILKEFNVGKWPLGSKVNYSTKGNYLLLKQYAGIEAKDFEIVDAHSGAIVALVNQASAVKIANNESFYIVLKNNEVSFIDIKTNKTIKSFTAPKAANALALSRDGMCLAISQHPSKAKAEQSPLVRNAKKQKKATQLVLEFKQIISIYDASTLKEITSVSEWYDNIYELEFSADNNKLICYSVPNPKIQQSTAGKQGYINVIETSSWKPLRESYVTLANVEPDFKVTQDKSLFGIISFDKFPQLNIYSTQTGRIIDRFNTEKRISDLIKEGIKTDSKASFDFLPDNSIIIQTGNIMYLWKPNLN